MTGFDGAGKRRRGRPRKIHAGILEGSGVTGFDGAGRKRRVGRPRKHHIGGETGGRVTGGEDGGRRRRVRRIHIGGEEGGRRTRAGRVTGGIPPQLKAWHAHVKKVRAMHPHLPYSEVLHVAKSSY